MTALRQRLLTIQGGQGWASNPLSRTCARAHCESNHSVAHPCPPQPNARRGRHPECSSDALEALALRVRCLSPDRRDPERFHVEKSELVAELRRFAAGLRRQA